MNEKRVIEIDENEYYDMVDECLRLKTLVQYLGKIETTDMLRRGIRKSHEECQQCKGRGFKRKARCKECDGRGMVALKEPVYFDHEVDSSDFFVVRSGE